MKNLVLLGAMFYLVTVLASEAIVPTSEVQKIREMNRVAGRSPAISLNK